MRSKNFLKAVTAFLALAVAVGCGFLLRSPAGTAAATAAEATTDYDGLTTVEVWLQAYKEDRDFSAPLGSEDNPYMSLRDLTVDACQNNDTAWMTSGGDPYYAHNASNEDEIGGGVLANTDLSDYERVLVHVTGDAASAYVVSHHDDGYVTTGIVSSYVMNGLAGFYINSENTRYPSADARKLLVELKGEELLDGDDNPYFPSIYYMSNESVFIWDDVKLSNVNFRYLSQDADGTVRRSGTPTGQKTPLTVYFENNRTVLGENFQFYGATIASNNVTEADTTTLDLCCSGRTYWTNDPIPANISNAGIGKVATANTATPDPVAHDPHGKDTAVLSGVYKNVYAFGEASYRYEPDVPHVFTAQNARFSNLLLFRAGASALGTASAKNKFTVNLDNVTVLGPDGASEGYVYIGDAPGLYTVMVDGVVRPIDENQNDVFADVEFNISGDGTVIGYESDKETGFRGLWKSNTTSTSNGFSFDRSRRWTGDLTVNVYGGTFSQIALLSGNNNTAECTYHGDAELNIYGGTVLNFVSNTSNYLKAAGGSAATNIYGGTFGRSTGVDAKKARKGIYASFGVFKDAGVSFPTEVNVFSGDAFCVSGAVPYANSESARLFDEITVTVRGDGSYPHPTISTVMGQGYDNTSLPYAITGKMDIVVNLFGGLGSDGLLPKYGTTNTFSTSNNIIGIRGGAKAGECSVTINFGDPEGSDAENPPVYYGMALMVAANANVTTQNGDLTFNMNSGTLYHLNGSTNNQGGQPVIDLTYNLNGGTVWDVCAFRPNSVSAALPSYDSIRKWTCNVQGAAVEGNLYATGCSGHIGEAEINITSGTFGSQSCISLSNLGWQSYTYRRPGDTADQTAKMYYAQGKDTYRRAQVDSATLNFEGGTFNATYFMLLDRYYNGTKHYTALPTAADAPVGSSTGGATNASTDGNAKLVCGTVDVNFAGGTYVTTSASDHRARGAICGGFGSTYEQVNVTVSANLRHSFTVSGSSKTSAFDLFAIYNGANNTITEYNCSTTADGALNRFYGYYSSVTNSEITEFNIENRGSISTGVFLAQVGGNGTGAGRSLPSVVIDNYGFLSLVAAGFQDTSSAATAHYSIAAHKSALLDLEELTINQYAGSINNIRPLIDVDYTLDTVNVNLMGGTIAGSRFVWNEATIDTVNFTMTGGTLSGSLCLCYGDGGLVRNANLKYLGGTVSGNTRLTESSDSDNGYANIPSAIRPAEGETYGWAKSKVENLNILIDGASFTSSASYYAANYENSRIEHIKAYLVSGSFVSGGLYAVQSGSAGDVEVYLLGEIPVTGARTFNASFGGHSNYSVYGTVDSSAVYLLGGKMSERRSNGEYYGAILYLGSFTSGCLGNAAFFTNGGAVNRILAGSRISNNNPFKTVIGGDLTTTFSTQSYRVQNEALGIDVTVQPSDLTVNGSIRIDGTYVEGAVSTVIENGFRMHVNSVDTNTGGTGNIFNPLVAVAFDGTVTGTLNVDFGASPAAPTLVKVPTGTTANVTYESGTISRTTENGFDLYRNGLAEPCFAGRTLVFDAAFAVRYLIDAADLDGYRAAGYTITSLTASVGGGAGQNLTLSDDAILVDGGRYYWVKVKGIAPKDIGQSIVLTLTGTLNGDTLTDVYEDSVYAALKQVSDLEGVTTRFGKAARATLEYCQAAADAFGVEAAYWTDVGNTVPDVTGLTGIAECASGSGDVNFIGTSLVLKNELAIKFWADASGYAGSIGDVTLTVNGEAVSCTAAVNAGSAGYWTFTLALPADRLASPLSVELRTNGAAISNTYTDSVQNYAISAVNAAGAQAEVGQAILNYISYVNEYLAPLAADPADDGVLRILAVGNSFCTYFPDELYGMLTAAGIEAQVCNVYYSGCYLSQHWGWYVSNTGNYDFITNDANGKTRVSNKTLRECFEAENWDVVTLQQHFNLIVTESYEYAMTTVTPYIDQLVNLFREYNPQADFYWHETWAYQVGYDRSGVSLTSVENQTHQFEVNKAVSEWICDTYGLPMIPDANAWQIARANPVIGDTLCDRIDEGTGAVKTDCYHDGNVGGGQFLNACVWYEILTGNDCRTNTFRPDTDAHSIQIGLDYHLDETLVSALQEAAHEAVAAYRASQI